MKLIQSQPLARFIISAIFLILLNFSAFQGKAQGKFFGGDGCGYAVSKATVNLQTLAVDPNPGQEGHFEANLPENSPVRWFPNPARGVLHFENLSGKEFSLLLLSPEGKVLGSWNTIGGESGQIEVSGFAAGLYFLRVISGGKSEVSKIVLE
ncbi:MAG: T9SS type A sorting domain-containing protein [Bacteroidia bacterium]|nr:T9SS type A sorting domain-containing protein [Bacteroidia bacterium]